MAAQLLAREAGVVSHATSARVPISFGQWAVLRSFRMNVGKDGEAPLAVTIQECPAAERLEVFARCFGLTPRQRTLLGLAASGLDTAALAAALGITPYTVQDQFKAVFAAGGVRSRNALLHWRLGHRPPPRRRSSAAVLRAPRRRSSAAVVRSRRPGKISSRRQTAAEHPPRRQDPGPRSGRGRPLR